jgi:hypothetical protein
MMINLQPNESLTGNWIVQDGKAHADATYERMLGLCLITFRRSRIAPNRGAGKRSIETQMVDIGNVLILKAECTAADRLS